MIQIVPSFGATPAKPNNQPYKIKKILWRNLHYVLSIFYGRIKRIAIDTQSNNTCSFVTESNVKFNESDCDVAFQLSNDKINSLDKVPGEFVNIDKEIFAFLSAHSKDRLRVEYEKSLEVQDTSETENASQIDNGSKTENKPQVKNSSKSVNNQTGSCENDSACKVSQNSGVIKKVWVCNDF